MSAASFVPFLQRSLSELDSPSKLLYGAVMVLIIVYAPVISRTLRTRADSFMGRLMGLGLIYGVCETLGWIYGLLTAVAFLMLIHSAEKATEGFGPKGDKEEGFGPSSRALKSPKGKEGFDGGGSVTEKKRVGKRWFVEQVLGEHPSKIATDRVQTAAIQDS